MPNFIGLIGLLATAGHTATLLPVSDVTVTDGQLRLGQVVKLHGFDADAKKTLSNLVIADFAHAKAPKEISSKSIRRWAIAAAPKLRFHSNATQNTTVRFVTSNLTKDESTPFKQSCFSLSVRILRDEIVTKKNVTAVSCKAKRGLRVVYFDSNDRVVRALQNLSAGTYLGSLNLSDVTPTDSGASLAFVTHEGPVQVIRQVRALQPAVSGKNLFVVANDGTVFATKYRTSKNQLNKNQIEGATE